MACSVGDILLAGTDDEMGAAEAALRTFRERAIDELTRTSPMAFRGILLGRSPTDTWDLLISRRRYDTAIREIDAAQYISQWGIADAPRIRTAIRKSLGSLICLRKIRPSIGFDIPKLATDSVAAYVDCTKAM